MHALNLRFGVANLTMQQQILRCEQSTELGQHSPALFVCISQGGEEQLCLEAAEQAHTFPVCEALGSVWQCSFCFLSSESNPSNGAACGAIRTFLGRH